MDIFTTLNLLPQWYQYILVILLGLIIGSFLNVVIYRYNTGKSLNGSSHCLSCAKPLQWFELFPVVSYLVLRGRCRGCGSFIPVRYMLVELLTAAVFLMAFIYTAWSIDLLLQWVLLAILVVITMYDSIHFIIPDKLVMAVAVLGLIALGQLGGETQLLTSIWSAIIAAVIVIVFYAGLWKFSDGRWIGLGDAKLAAPLTLFLVPTTAFSFVVLSFWIGAAVSVALLVGQYVLKRGQPHLRFLRIPLTIKSEVPFAPFIIISFLLTYYTSVNVFDLLSLVCTSCL